MLKRNLSVYCFPSELLDKCWLTFEGSSLASIISHGISFPIPNSGNHTAFYSTPSIPWMCNHYLKGKYKFFIVLKQHLTLWISQKSLWKQETSNVCLAHAWWKVVVIWTFEQTPRFKIIWEYHALKFFFYILMEIPCIPAGPKSCLVKKIAWSWCSEWLGSDFCCWQAQRHTFSKLLDGFPLSMRLMD